MATRKRSKYEKRVTVCFTLAEVALLDTLLRNYHGPYGVGQESRSECVRRLVTEAHARSSKKSDTARGTSDAAGGTK